MQRGSRLTVINPDVLAHMMEHPARGRRWSVREMAQVTGCSSALIGFLRTGDRRHVDEELAHQIAAAVGCQTHSLFMPALSATVDNKPVKAAS